MLSTPLLLLAPLLSPPAGPSPQSPATVPGATLGESLARVAERDGRLEFTAGTAASARRAIDLLKVDLEPLQSPGAVQAWCEALFALGAGGDVTARAELVELASQPGAQPQTLAAILALGALGPRLGSAERSLAEWAAEDDPVRARHALLAWTLARPEAGRAAADARALEDPFAAALAVHRSPDPLPEDPAVRRWYGLRLGAARSFGLVDGRPWRELGVEQLAGDGAFLEEWILEQLGHSSSRAVLDHLLAMLLEDPTPARIRAAVRLMPGAVEAVVREGLWLPRGDAGWRELAQGALESARPEAFTAVFEACAEIPASRWLALPVVARTRPELLPEIESGLRRTDSSVALELLRGIASTDWSATLPALRRLEGIGDPELEAEALIVRVRLGDGNAYQSVVDLVTAWTQGEETAVCSFLPSALARHRRGGLVLRLCEDLVQDLPLGAPTRLTALAALRDEGRSAATSDLLAEVARATRGAAGRVLGLEALGRVPNEAELQYLVGEFPGRERRETDLALAGALLRAGRVEVEPLLAAALWTGGLHLSTFAAALIDQSLGRARLVLWALEPPVGTSSADLRRVGYGLGQLGGMPLVEELTRRAGASAGTDRPLLQGALLGALGARTQQ